VTHDSAISVLSTKVRTGIFALLIYTSQLTRALGVTDAFGFAVWRISDHSWQTRARCLVANNATLRIRPARRRLARVGWSLLNDLILASNEWISCMSRRTTTYWIVVYDLTLGANSTSSRARVSTFLIATCFVLWTLVTCNTFRSAGGRRANIPRDTRTYSLSVSFAALRVGSTGRGLAWVGLDRC